MTRNHTLDKLARGIHDVHGYSPPYHKTRLIRGNDSRQKTQGGQNNANYSLDNPAKPGNHVDDRSPPHQA